MADENSEKDGISASETTSKDVVDDVGSVVDAIADEDGVSQEEGIADLRKSIEDQKRMIEEERQRRIEAEQAAYQARVQAASNDQQLKASHYHEVQSRIAFAAERERALMADWTDAKSMGDYAREAEVQKALIQNSNDMRVLEQAKGKLESMLRQPVQPVPEPMVSIAETWARQCGNSSDAAWLRSHEDKIRDDRTVNRVRAYHDEALESGYQQSTPEYYRYIEERAGWRRPSRRDEDDEDGDASSYAAKPRRSAPPPSAPVSRGGDRKGTFRLSAEQREIAKMCGQTEEEYYRNMQKEQKRANGR
jgi:hypothetical protein